MVGPPYPQWEHFNPLGLVRQSGRSMDNIYWASMIHKTPLWMLREWHNLVIGVGGGRPGLDLSCHKMWLKIIFMWVWSVLQFPPLPQSRLYIPEGQEPQWDTAWYGKTPSAFLSDNLIWFYFYLTHSELTYFCSIKWALKQWSQRVVFIHIRCSRLASLPLGSCL